MSRAIRFSGRMVIAAAIVPLFLAGCKDDDPPACVNCTNTWRTPSPTIENVWPNADKSSWTYSYISEELQVVPDPRTYSTPDSVSDVLTWDDLRELLDGHHLAGPTNKTVGTYGMHFDSLLTTDSGAVGQNLVVEITPRGGVMPTSSPVRRPGGFLARLYAARPDLRDAVGAALAATARPEPGGGTAGVVFGPFLIHGGAWEKTSDYIGTYGDVDQLLAWKFLTSDLSAGAEFSHQLVPSLADDVFLYGRVERTLSWESGIGLHKNCIEVLYIIDYGVSLGTDATGQPLEYARIVDGGRVIYAPTLGPVYMYEIGFIQQGEALANGARYTELDLFDRHTPASALVLQHAGSRR